LEQPIKIGENSMKSKFDSLNDINEFIGILEMAKEMKPTMDQMLKEIVELILPYLEQVTDYQRSLTVRNRIKSIEQYQKEGSFSRDEAIALANEDLRNAKFVLPPININNNSN
jgi:uncharacterized protein with von Willebrand factor type A (vWA) domain